MSTTEVAGKGVGAGAGIAKTDLKLEVVTIPVSNVDRAKEFYAGLGWRLDADIARGDDFRIVQFTPPGSECSIHFGTGLTTMQPGSLQRIFLVVSDIEAARGELIALGVEVGEVTHTSAGSYGSYASWSDPDGNGWVLQEVTTRLPGRVERETTYASVVDLVGALTRAAAAHGEHEKRTGAADPNWPDWYAAYMVAEATGTELPT